MEPTPAADLFEVMGSTRAIRRFRTDSVPDHLLERLVWAGTRAPSPGNTQGWDFVVLTDPEKKARIGAAMRDSLGPRLAAMPRGDASNRRVIDGAAHLADTFDTVPAVIFVCGPVIYPASAPREQMTWAALYPAAQNILLAARGLGLGAVFTTFHHSTEPVVREVLGIPDHIRIGVTIPVGWPDSPFGDVARLPLEQYTHRNGWQGEKRPSV